MYEDITFKNRQVDEFCGTVNLYLNMNERFKLFEESNLKVHDNVVRILSSIDENISSFLKKEIEFFFKLDSIDVMLFGFTDDYRNVTNIDEFFKVFDEASDIKIFDFIGGTFLGSYYADENKGWNEVNHSMESMMEYIENIKEIKKSLKKDIIGLYNSPKETRMRLRYIIKSLYEVYSVFEDEINTLQREKENELVKEFKDNPELFFKKNIIEGVIPIEKETIEISVSYMRYAGFRWLRRSDNSIYLNLGYNTKELVEGTKRGENYDKFLKLISDKTRQKILTLISKEPWYTQALAKELKLTPATVHYHLQNFLAIGLVSIREEDNKAYYSLEKDMANKYISILQEKLNLI